MLVSVILQLFLSHVSLYVLVDGFHVCAIVGGLRVFDPLRERVRKESLGDSASDHSRLAFCVTMSTMLGGARVFTGKYGFGLDAA